MRTRMSKPGASGGAPNLRHQMSLSASRSVATHNDLTQPFDKYRVGRLLRVKRTALVSAVEAVRAPLITGHPDLRLVLLAVP